jgi:hypothetical protein
VWSVRKSPLGHCGGSSPQGHLRDLLRPPAVPDRPVRHAAPARPPPALAARPAAQRTVTTGLPQRVDWACPARITHLELAADADGTPGPPRPRRICWCSTSRIRPRSRRPSHACGPATPRYRSTIPTGPPSARSASPTRTAGRWCAPATAQITARTRRLPPGEIVIELYSGARNDLRSLFELAEDSPGELDSYLHAGRVLVARQGQPRSVTCRDTPDRSPTGRSPGERH